MSAPLIWIGIPGVMAVLLLLTYRWQLIGTLVASITATVLVILAFVLPPGGEYAFGPLTVEITESLSVLGRETIIRTGDIPEVVIIYWGAALWILGSYFARSSRLFPSIALGMAALQVAAITIQPFLYAAVFIELLAILSVPLVAETGKQVQQGVLRLIVFFTLGMAALLFVGWLLTTGATGIPDSELIFNAAIFLAAGFIFFLTLFPAHSWVPQLLEKGNPFTAAFIVFWLTQAALLFSNSLLLQYDLIGAGSPGAQVVVGVAVLMIVIFGLYLLFQNHLGRILGFAILIEVGFSLLAVGLQSGSSGPVFYSLLFQKSLPFMLWALALASYHRQSPNLELSELRGAGWRFPWTGGGLLLAQLTIVGLPLLPIFSVKALLFANIQFEDRWVFLGITAGLAGLALVLLRTLSALYGSTDDDPDPAEGKEGRGIRILLIACILLLFATGLLSGFILPAFL